MIIKGIFGGTIEMVGNRENEIEQLQVRVDDPNNLVLDPIGAAALGAALTQWADQVPARLQKKALEEDRAIREWQKSQGKV